MLKKWSVSWLFIAILSACEGDLPTTDEANFCPAGEAATAACEVTHETDALTLTLFSSDADMPTETPLALRIVPSEPIADMVRAEVRGRSMYMGRIPLVLEADGDDWVGELLLGACTDPDMVWQLELTLELTNGKTLEFIIPFQSSLP